MALKLSTGLRDALAGDVASRVDSTSQIAFVNASSTFTDLSSAFLTDGFRPGDIITVTESASNNGLFTIVSVAAGTITVSQAVVNESVGGNPTIVARSKALKDLFKYSVLDIYSGSAPSTADAAETGTKLLSITVSAGAFTAGTLTNGLQFDAISEGTLSKSAATWSDAALATGTAGYFRLYDNGYITGTSTTSIRLQGTIGTSGADLNISSTSLTLGATTTVDTFDITVPAS